MGLVCIINSLRLIHSRFSLAAADVVGITQSIASMREERDQLEKTVALLNHTANYDVLLIVVCCRDKHPRRPRECWSQCDRDPMLGECWLLLYFVDC